MTPQSDAKTSLHFFSYPLASNPRECLLLFNSQGIGFLLRYPDANYYLSQLEGITF